VVRLAVLAAVAALVWHYRAELTRDLPLDRFLPSSRDWYAAQLRVQSFFGSEAAREWLSLASAAVAGPDAAQAPFERDGVFGDVSAGSWRFPVRRGQRVIAELTYPHPEAFVDLLTAGGTSVASAPRGSSRLQYDAVDDADLILRVQPPLHHPGAFRLVTRLEASLLFPVEGVKPTAFQSTFGGPRNAGRRQHDGVDIFAPRGTPVLAAVDGWVTGSTTNTLGGNVVWVWSPGDTA
jgi:peptidoglycan LD-endopeptidase LytH